MQLKQLAQSLALVTVMAAVGCAGGEEDAAGEEEGAPAVAEIAMPDTTIDAVWAHIEGSNYQSWAMWPGKEALYSGGEPHGMLLTTYMNGVALDALNGDAAVFPAGAIIVKENYMPDSTLAAVTVMYKTENFNGEHNNWYFVKRNADGSVDVAGRGEGCQNCHGAARANDYVLTAPLNPAD